MDRFVSRKIQRLRCWNDCDALVTLWNEAVQDMGATDDRTTTTNGNTLFYLELGGNIGSCLMDMLQSTNATIVIFEPHPLNLSQMTTTLMKQP